MEVDDIPPDPRRRNWQSHAAILDATVEQLASVGYHRLTIEGIAAQAGVSKATVYRWWPTKARLIIEALSKRSDIERVAATGDVRADARAIVQRVIEIMTKTPLGQVLPPLGADFNDDPQARIDLIEWLGRIRASCLALLYEAAGRGDLPYDIDAELILDLLVGTVMYRYLFAHRVDDRLVDQLADLIANGQLPRAGAIENLLR